MDGKIFFAICKKVKNLSWYRFIHKVQVYPLLKENMMKPEDKFGGLLVHVNLKIALNFQKMRLPTEMCNGCSLLNIMFVTDKLCFVFCTH